MSEPQPPAAALPPKKKLPPLAWFAIGCGVLILLSLGTCAVGTWWVARKVKSLADNPDAAIVAAAEIALRANPDVEVISSDPKKGTITVRDKKSGREITFSLEDIKAGRLSVRSGDEETTITFDQSDSGAIRVDAGQGKVTIGAGAGEPPSWIPSYPRGRLEGFFEASTATEKTGGFTLVTNDPPQEVLDFFEKELQARGFSVNRFVFQVGGHFGSLTAEQEGRSIQLTLTGEGEETKGLLQFTERKDR